jgi:hypothetical protein
MMAPDDKQNSNQEGLRTPSEVEASLNENPKVQEAWDEHMKEKNPDDTGSIEEEATEGGEEESTDTEDEDATDGDEGKKGKKADESDEESDEEDEQAGDDEETDEDQGEDTESASEEVFKYKAGKKEREFALRLTKDGKLTQRSRAELEKKLTESGKGDALTVARNEVKSWEDKYTKDITARERQLEEVVRQANKREKLDEPIKHLLNLVRSEPDIRLALEQNKDPRVQGLLAKHGFDVKKPSHEYDYTTAEKNIGVVEEAAAHYREVVGGLTDTVSSTYQKEKGLSDDAMLKILKWGRENLDFMARTGPNGKLLKPEDQAAWFGNQLKNAHARMVVEGILETPGHTKARADSEESKKKLDREKARQKKRNQQFKSAGAPGKAPTVDRNKPKGPREGQTTEEYLASLPSVKKAAQESGIKYQRPIPR